MDTILDESSTSIKEIRSRIEEERGAFIRMKNFSIKKELNMELRFRLLKCCIYLLYGCESWTMNQTSDKRIETLELYLYQRIVKRFLAFRK